MRSLVLSGMCLFLWATSIRAQSPSRELVVAEVRADGHIVPVGVWDGVWRQARHPDRARALFRVPASWHYRAFSGDTARFRTGRVVALDDYFMYDTWGIISNLPRPRAIRDSIARVGLATSEPLPIALFAAAPDTILRRVRDRVLTILDSAARHNPYDSLLPLRKGDTVTVTGRGARTPGGGWAVSFVVERPIGRMREGSPCAFSAYYTGWASVEGGRVQLSGAPVLDDCDRKLVTDVNGSGIFELGGRTFIVGVVQMWEEADRVIWEWTPRGIAHVLTRYP